jgi:hypothetical protein
MYILADVVISVVSTGSPIIVGLLQTPYVSRSAVDM